MINATLPPFLLQLPHNSRTPCFYQPEVFAPGEAAPTELHAREARLLCAACPVRAACADWAINTSQPRGIWGGLTPAERRAARRPECGTEAGWRSHRSRGEGCTTCREAHDERLRAGRRARLDQEHRKYGGSLAAYRLELLLGLPTCLRCRAVRQAYYAGRPRTPKWYRRTAA
ncbi:MULTISPECIES: WhiB family transcriptional regulator [unclassified Streptomyces]|uniref:WhiB family transcriptional regulator n=1 Tax=unclassified Streptomyces TaxID=2593676 RepID=UPI0006911B80|nr:MULTISPECIES: WhiB family transcriptional regulator [unclassified Streptomyces]